MIESKTIGVYNGAALQSSLKFQLVDGGNNETKVCLVFLCAIFVCILFSNSDTFFPCLLFNFSHGKFTLSSPIQTKDIVVNAIVETNIRLFVKGNAIFQARSNVAGIVDFGFLTVQGDSGSHLITFKGAVS